MARANTMSRNLSLTEELERLEQSITLTLQEIDHNFSKAHRIVTTNILPLVDRYGEHSRAVWEASKFWKQFFEASANVSLSGYEETTNQEFTSDEVANDDATNNEVTNDEGFDGQDSTALEADVSVDFTLDDNDYGAGNESGDLQSLLDPVDDSILGQGDAIHSTSRRSPQKTREATVGGLEGHDETSLLLSEDDTMNQFSQRTARLLDFTMSSRKGLNDHTLDQAGPRHKDPLLHRVLDKNFRLQATPHKLVPRASPVKEEKRKEIVAPPWLDLSPMSSPETAQPKLRTEAFKSPFKTNRKWRGFGAEAAGPRTPGVSVQTPVAARKTGNLFGKELKYEIDWDSDDDTGISPPRTFQFDLPTSKLLQTPAKEASKKIIGDILKNAGVDVDSSEYSVKVGKDADDSF